MYKSVCEEFVAVNTWPRAFTLINGSSKYCEDIIKLQVVHAAACNADNRLAGAANIYDNLTKFCRYRIRIIVSHVLVTSVCRMELEV